MTIEQEQISKDLNISQAQSSGLKKIAINKIKKMVKE